MTYTPVYEGRIVTKAQKGLILLHGRGGSAKDILNLAPLLVDDSFFVVALNAPENSWYPNNFLHENNEPKLTASIKAVNDLIEETAKHIPYQELYLAGFSQGACLALETTARNAKKYGGIMAFSGGLIGKTLDPTKYKGDYQKTPIFLGCSDNDPHIPEFRLKESQEQLEALNAVCTLTIYPGMGHTISHEEIAFAKKPFSKPLQVEKISFVKESLQHDAYNDTDFIKCDFTETLFYNTHFSDCVFIQCQFNLNKWDGARLQNCQFVDCKLVGADLFKCEPLFFSPTFKNCHIILANFSELPMNEVMFDSCKLSECYFNHTQLKKANFSGSILTGSRFHGCDLTKADFSKASDYFIDPAANTIKQAKFSLPEAIGLLKGLEIDLV